MSGRAVWRRIFANRFGVLVLLTRVLLLAIFREAIRLLWLEIIYGIGGHIFIVGGAIAVLLFECFGHPWMTRADRVTLLSIVAFHGVFRISRFVRAVRTLEVPVMHKSVVAINIARKRK